MKRCYLFIAVFLIGCNNYFDYNNADFNEELSQSNIFNENYIIVGNGGVILKSKDGLYWEDKSIYNDFDNVGVASDGDLYLIIGKKNEVINGVYNYNFKTAYSYDLENWKIGINDESGNGGYGVNDAMGIVYIEDKFYLFGQGLAQSLNGISFFQSGYTPGIDVRSMIKANGLFVLVGDASVSFSTIEYGFDLGSMLGQSFPDNATRTKVKYIENEFVVLREDGVIEYGDQINSMQSYVLDISGLSLNGIALGSDRYVVVGDSGIYLTEDLALDSWEHVESGCVCNSVVYKNSEFVVVGDGGKILKSNDGRSWQESISNTNEDLNEIY